jgi:F1F0 ATPase subunit 2
MRGRGNFARRVFLRRPLVDGAEGTCFERPALWFLGSLLLRTGIVLAGIYFVSGGRWDGLLACLAGFVIARFIVTRLAKLPAGQNNSPVKEPAHAP